MTTDHKPHVVRPSERGPLNTVPDEAHYRRGEQARRWGSLLLIIGVVWLVFALAARGPLTGLGLNERRQEIPQQAFAVQRVVITGLNDQVRFVDTGGDEVLVQGAKHGFGWNGDAAESSLERLELVVETEGDTLRLDVRRSGLPGVGRTPFVDLQVALPAGVVAEAELVSGDIAAEDIRGDLRFATVSGAVQANGTEGALTVRTTSGDISVEDHAGALEVETTSGDVQADGALAGARVETVSGDVELEGVRDAVEMTSISGSLSLEADGGAQLRIESTSGDVEFQGALAEGGSSRISNISGDVRVRLAEPADLRLDLTTLSGDLETDLPLRDQVRERRSLSGTLGTGATTLTVNTTSGDVEVAGE